MCSVKGVVTIKGDTQTAEEFQAYSSANNKSRILHALRAEPGLSKIALTRQLGLSSGTVTLLTRELVERKLVVGGDFEPSTGGRPAQRLWLNPQKPLMLGILLRDTVQLGVVNLRGELVASTHLTMPRSNGRADLDMLLDDALRMARQYGVAGAGVAVPSQIDRATGTVLRAKGLGWHDMPVLSDVEEKLGMPTVVGRSGEAALMAEDWWGAAPAGDPFVFVTAGPGVTAATKVHGRVLRGASDQAGLLGHVVVDPVGPKCACGQRGCLTTMASSEAVVDRYKDLHRQAGTKPCEVADHGAIKALMAASAGDDLALDALRYMADMLGRGLVIMVSLINPRVIVMGGEFLDAKAVVMPRIANMVHESALSGAAVDVVPSTLGGDTAVIGAATLAFDRVFSEPTRDWVPDA